MENKLLHIFVEGVDDERFFNQVIKPFFKGYHYVKITAYRNEPKNEILRHIQTCRIKKSDYIFVADLDSRGNPLCFTRKKEAINEKFKSRIDDNKIAIIKEEIESWYAAGMSSEFCQKHNTPNWGNTDRLTKEEFERHIPGVYKPNTFMVEILKDFDLEKAKIANTSFAYFYKKYLNG